MKRIFIAIPITPSSFLSIRERINSFPSFLKEEIGEVKNIKWIQQKNLHLTLVPPWKEDNISEISNKLSVVSCEPFEIHLNKVTFGPNPRQPRLIWTTGPAVPELEFLQKQILSVLGKKSDRPLLPHVTLARFRPEDFKYFSTKVLDKEMEWNIQVSSFVLMESRLSPQGADYNILAEFLL